MIPAREGELFNPDTFPFLEGRPAGSKWRQDPGEVPALDDGVVKAVLTRLVHLEGQRLSYRNLDVEQIGSVYESLMGFALRQARGVAVALRPEGRGLDLADVRKAEDPCPELQFVQQNRATRRSFGGSLRAIQREAQEREAAIACGILNRMSASGRPESYSNG